MQPDMTTYSLFSSLKNNNSQIDIQVCFNFNFAMKNTKQIQQTHILKPEKVDHPPPYIKSAK